MAKLAPLYTLILFVSCTWCNGQSKINLFTGSPAFETKEVPTSNAPANVTRNIRQDKKGNIWIAAFDGIFRYNPTIARGPLRSEQEDKSFTNITNPVSKARFFSLIEDRKGNFWFTSIGSGVYYYDGKSFQNFTTKEGLANDRVPYSYEDKSGNIWFGTEGGASRYNGSAFKTYQPNGGLPGGDKNDNDVNAIIEDKTGKFWFGTRGKTYTYNGKTFSLLTNEGKPFTNVRCIIEDKKGNIWLGGNDGLWRYDGTKFTNLTLNFVGYICEDKKGNIWTSSQRQGGPNGKWLLSRYDAKSLSSQKPTVMEIESEPQGNAGMVFGILEANDGTIWYGGLDGVRRFDGKTITHFKNRE